GSLGLDLETAVAMTLIDNCPQKIPTVTVGPLIIDGTAVGALLIGRSSSGVKGLIILPGLIDADYTGQIVIVAHTPFPPTHIPARTRSKVAQLIPLPHLAAAIPATSERTRGSAGFGSTGAAAMLTLAMGQRPSVTVTFQHGLERRLLMALLDTQA
ncbi:hypothetical protein N306_02194, partial [Opisthocomus hoazin]